MFKVGKGLFETNSWSKHCVSIRGKKKLDKSNLPICSKNNKVEGKFGEFSDGVDNLKEEMYNNLENMMNKFDVISFDNLALEQLKVKRLLSDKEWNEFFMGDDGYKEFTSASMYIDLVNSTFSFNSMDKERFALMNNVKDMFDYLRTKKSKNKK